MSYYGGYIHIPVAIADGGVNTENGYPYNLSACSTSCAASSTSSPATTKTKTSMVVADSAADISFCSENCITGCHNYLSEEQTKQKNLCCHWHEDSSAADDNFLCEANCGQVENMSSCGVVFKDVEDGKKGTLVCTRSCDTRCPVFADSDTTIVSYDNYFPHPTIFQQPAPYNCETGGSGEIDCNILTGENNTAISNPWQNCVYKLKSFQNASLNMIQSFEDNKYAGGKGDRNFDNIMTNWCSEQVLGNCPDDPITGLPNSKCVRLRQNSEEGTKCAKWLNDKKIIGNNEASNFVDAIASRYCGRYPSSAECACFSRGLRKEYQDTKSVAPYNDGCWYLPCNAPTFGSFYLVPSDVDTTLNPDMCPSDVCLSFINADGYNSVYVDDNRQYINCDFDTQTN